MPEPQRLFIEKSYLVAPERIDEFVLDDVHYDAGNRYSGARFRYALAGHQETRLDIFVYPAGRMPQATAIESGMAEFKAGIQAAQEAGQYRDVAFLGEIDFPLDDTKPAAMTPEGTDKKEARLLAIINSANPVGKRLRMQYTQAPGDFAMQSNGYLFYRQLFFFKVRVSAARERIAGADFQALADRAARTLVTSIEVANLGGCSKKVIEVPKDADAEIFAEILVRRSAEIQGENCFEDIGNAKLDEKSKGARIVTIEFSPDDWKTR